MKRKLRLVCGGVILCMLLGMSLPLCLADPNPEVTVSIDAPAEVAPGSHFTARVNVTEVSDFDACQFDVTYDPSVLHVIGVEGAIPPASGPYGVTDGEIGVTTIPIDMWGFVPAGTQGKVRVIGNVPGVSGVNGSGYLAEIHFHVIGSPGDTSAIDLSNGLLGDKYANPITPVTWVDASVYVSAVDLELTKDVDNPSPTAGEQVMFTITVINKGPSDATGVKVEDVVWPGNLSWSSDDSGGTYDSGTRIWDVGDLAVNASATLYITATVMEDGYFENVAEVYACDQKDKDSTPNNYPTFEDDNGMAGGEAGPTAVTLSSFAARSSASAEAHFAWPWLVGVVTLAMSGILWMRWQANKPGYHG